nr:hypothetical protein [Kutzneria chonburiensis]
MAAAAAPIASSLFGPGSVGIRLLPGTTEINSSVSLLDNTLGAGTPLASATVSAAISVSNGPWSRSTA